MPDWLSHVLIALILCEVFNIKRKSLVVLGSLLPDLVLKLAYIYFILGIDRHMLYKWLLPGHTIIGCILLTIAISPFFRQKLKKTFTFIFLGWASHLILDLTNKAFIHGQNWLLFPLTFKSYDLNLIWPDQYYFVLLPSIVDYFSIKFYKIKKQSDQTQKL